MTRDFTSVTLKRSIFATVGALTKIGKSITTIVERAAVHLPTVCCNISPIKTNLIRRDKYVVVLYTHCKSAMFA